MLGYKLYKKMGYGESKIQEKIGIKSYEFSKVRGQSGKFTAKQLEDIMKELLENVEQFEANGATVDFYKKIENGLSTYIFDTSNCGPPDPMVNAMVGLQILDENSRLIMINHKEPKGLYPKIEQEFNYEVEDIENKVKVIFTKKSGSDQSTDFSANSCSG